MPGFVSDRPCNGKFSRTVAMTFSSPLEERSI
jgi:hypothetical protein